MNETQRILIVEDEPTFAQVLARSLSKRGFLVACAATGAEALLQVKTHAPHYMILDLKLSEEVTLQLIPQFLAIQPQLKILMLTGYASIATAVEAIKLGALNYLPKPADTDDILKALGIIESTAEISLTEQSLDWRGHQWEQLQRTLTECEGNLSQAARTLGMHRRTLQRKLKKRPRVPK